jgi:hypothetical protein
LYIIEPAFLFYVRWRREKQIQAEQLDMFELLIQGLAENSHINRLEIDAKFDEK